MGTWRRTWCPAQLKRTRPVWSERRAVLVAEWARQRQVLFDAGGLVLEVIPASEYRSERRRQGVAATAICRHMEHVHDFSIFLIKSSETITGAIAAVQLADFQRLYFTAESTTSLEIRGAAAWRKRGPSFLCGANHLDDGSFRPLGGNTR